LYRWVKDKNIFFILLGIIGGLVLVFFSLVDSRLNPAKSRNIIALVNGRPIDRNVFETMYSALNDERTRGDRPAVDADTVLARMIEEELLVQRAVELGLPYSDKITRGYLIQNMLNLISKEASNLTPDTIVLKKFYDQNQAQFTKSARIAVQFSYTRGEDEISRQKAIGRKTAWESMNGTAFLDADDLPLSIPKGYLSFTNLANYIGTVYAEQFSALAVGELSDPVPYLKGWLTGKVIGRKQTPPPEFEAIEKQVLMAYRKARADDAVKEYLEDLKRSAEIEEYETP
jgi:hypothetical protein